MAEENNLKLCYIEPPWAWFTTTPLDEQWGDDWDDAPWQHNAGLPYQDDRTIVKVAYDGRLYTPGVSPRTEYDGIDDRIESGVSVKDMNRGDVPWLVETDYGEYYGSAGVKIDAGVSLPEFRELVEAANGTVYEP